MIVHTGRQRYPADHAYRRQDDLPCYTLELTYSGTMRRACRAVRCPRAQPNHALILTPPHTPFVLRGEESGDEIWVMFQPDPRHEALLSWPAGRFGVPELPVPRTARGRLLLAAFEDTHEYFSTHGPLRSPELAENALERLLLLTQRIPDEEVGELDPRIEKSLALMQESLGDPWTLDRLASAVNLSGTRFTHLFRQQTGTPPIRMLEEMRMERARQLLLKSDRSVQRIAEEVGYPDAFYFSTRFRKQSGCSPTAWRRNPTPWTAR